ncbi:F-box-like domain superfamily [Arabidopsis suecica]|uniref:F-box-like domain superfamily n=1 Tax=Arabidopsis suecica TaxID=45249 RepID=A0A8T2AH07_ARASU|nr:F-box-like domain superfamily [Arabidopsis suecica]
MLDLPSDMEEEVLSKVPVTSLGKLRLTCKKWNTLTKSESFLKKKQRNGIEVVMMVEYRVSLMSFNLLYPSIERIGILHADGIKISKISHCEGLFLCIITKDKYKEDSSRLVVWNPYLGQTRWIELPSNSTYHRWEKYAIGYEKEKKNKKHKVLRFVNEYDGISGNRICELEMYSLNSNSWKVSDDFTPDWRMSFKHSGLSLKGNTYWYAQERLLDHHDFLLSFDFTRERFGPRLPLPFHAFLGDTVTFSSVREEQLAVLFQKRGAPRSVVKIWITNKIEPNAVSWSNLFLAVDMGPVIGRWFPNLAGSFFVDEEKKVAVVLGKERYKCYAPTRNIAYIIGNNGILKKVDLGESKDKGCCYPLVCSYVPSSVKIRNTP